MNFPAVASAICFISGIAMGLWPTAANRASSPGFYFGGLPARASRNYVAHMFTSIAMEKALPLRALARCGGYDGQVSVRATLAAQLVPDPGEEAVSPYVWSRGFKQIDVLAIQRSRRRHRISRAISSSK
jgi:hypothetical protein